MKIILILLFISGCASYHSKAWIENGVFETDSNTKINAELEFDEQGKVKRAKVEQISEPVWKQVLNAAKPQTLKMED